MKERKCLIIDTYFIEKIITSFLIKKELSFLIQTTKENSFLLSYDNNKKLSYILTESFGLSSIELEKMKGKIFLSIPSIYYFLKKVLPFNISEIKVDEQNCPRGDSFTKYYLFLDEEDINIPKATNNEIFLENLKDVSSSGELLDSKLSFIYENKDMTVYELSIEEVVDICRVNKPKYKDLTFLGISSWWDEYSVAFSNESDIEIGLGDDYYHWKVKNLDFSITERFSFEDLKPIVLSKYKKESNCFFRFAKDSFYIYK